MLPAQSSLLPAPYCAPLSRGAHQCSNQSERPSPSVLQAIACEKKGNEESITETIPLFAEYPVLEAHIPYRSLAKLPTPVERLARLEDELDLREFYVKRDDQSGLEYGGNKVRKLEFLLAEAKTRGCKSVLTFGAAAPRRTAKRTGIRDSAICAASPKPAMGERVAASGRSSGN